MRKKKDEDKFQCRIQAQNKNFFFFKKYFLYMHSNFIIANFAQSHSTHLSRMLKEHTENNNFFIILKLLYSVKIISSSNFDIL
jgi:hypothetical protein